MNIRQLLSCNRRVLLILTLLQTNVLFAINSNSLWIKAEQSGKKSLFENKTASKIGDLLLVNFTESIKIKPITGNEAQDHANKFFLFNKLLDHVQKKGGPKWTVPAPFHPNQDLEIRGSITMQVIDVLPNDNLVLEGVRKKRLHDYVQHEIFRGLARRQDIAHNNTIDSNLLSDFSVEHRVGTSDSQLKSKGIFTRVNELINPF